MSLREPVYLLLGDEKLAADPAFAALTITHADLLDALGREGSAEAEMEHCTALGNAMDPRLAAFYAACLTRRDDFLLADIAKDPGPVHGPGSRHDVIGGHRGKPA